MESYEIQSGKVSQKAMPAKLIFPGRHFRHLATGSISRVSSDRAKWVESGSYLMIYMLGYALRQDITKNSLIEININLTSSVIIFLNTGELIVIRS